MKYAAPSPQEWADAQPHAMWAEARAAGAAVPAAPSSYDAREAVVVTQFAAADAVVRDAETFSSSIHTQTAGVFKGETMRGMDGDEHRRHRALVATAFRPSAVERWRTTAIEPVCYLQDLFTSEAARGKGVGRALINGVYDEARRAGSSRVYWQTHETNRTAMQLYDKVAEKSGFVVYRKLF